MVTYKALRAVAVVGVGVVMAVIGLASPVSAADNIHTRPHAIGVSPSQTTCHTNIAFMSKANGRYVSAELGYTGGNYGMLRARATTVGPWELFTQCVYDDGSSVFYSQANGKYVTAELGYTGSNYGMLRARSTTIGPWEHFDVSTFVAYYGIYSPAAHLWVSAELGYTGGNYAMLRAHASVVNTWEEFV